MERNEILANFQARTGIEDIGQCIAHLEQSDWNLNEAVSVAIAANAAMPSPPAYNSIPERFSVSSSVFPEFQSGSDAESSSNKANAAMPSPPAYNSIPEQFSVSSSVFPEFQSGSDAERSSNKDHHNFISAMRRILKGIKSQVKCKTKANAAMLSPPAYNSTPEQFPVASSVFPEFRSGSDAESGSNKANAAMPSPPPAYNSIPEQSVSPSVFPEFQSGSDAKSSSNKVRMINFLIHLNNTTKHICLDETATLGTLRQLAAKEFGIPKREVCFYGWPTDFADILPNDITLGILKLPSDISLTVRSVANGATSAPSFHEFGIGNNITIGDDEDTPFPLPCAVFKDNNEKLREIYILEVTDKRTRKIHNVRFNGTKTFEELRQDIYSLTGITPHRQVWDNLASNYNGVITPGHTMASLKLNTPTHKCSVTSQSDSGSSSVPIDLTVEEDTMEVDEFEEASENPLDDLLFSDDTPTTRSLPPLMPEKALDEVAALAQFQSEFNSRYGDDFRITPDFQIDSLDTAIQEAFGGSARNRKILAVYLHHDKSIQNNVFCSQLLCAPSVVEYMANHCVIWAWDITSEFNKKRMLDMCTQSLGSNLADTVKRVPQDGFPMLVLVQGRGSSCKVNSIIQGSTSLDELMVKLVKADLDADMQKQEDVLQEEMSEALELSKREQERAYQESLKQDMEKQ